MLLLNHFWVNNIIEICIGFLNQYEIANNFIYFYIIIIFNS